ncbi:Fe-S cluster assembly protein SufD [Acanthopleuribacter pedis]|uniref:Fe-S cluster assembly protein SufD n=1 Tax=Acanthopleuribacter pedis TaxID=442870 RepID=A0A8J7Q3Y1_9BACT|nr:Fe-S cluster assembly protein SufD [Acanthopleuribacter pedis]MBO1320122.1 Fe-S cluster assembly protein SufD [Acanthopleuribacter pedis]
MSTLTVHNKLHEDFSQNSGAGPAALRPLREQAFARFAATGFPTTRDEAWRFTSTRALTQVDWQRADQQAQSQLDDLKATVAHHALKDVAATTLVFVNGFLREDLSQRRLPAGVRLLSLADAAQEDWFSEYYAVADAETASALPALNTALADSATVLVLDAEARLENPLEIIHLSCGISPHRATFPRTMVVAKPMAEATVLETFIGSGGEAYWQNSVSQLHLADGARVTHVLAELATEQAFHTHATFAHLSRDSKLVSENMLIGGALARNDIHVNLNGPGAEAHINGLFLGHARQHLDNHVVVRHNEPHGCSFQNFRGILDDKAHGVFTGRIFVAQDAQKTDSAQSNRNLLLSDEARIDTKPQLEIYADDVKCAHGATTGQLNQDALFYLQSRGMAPDAARNFLIYAFAHELIEKLAIRELREHLEAVLVERFGQAGALAPEA